MLIHWQSDPVLISLGPLAIRWYGLLFAAPFLVGQYFFARVFREEGIPEKNIDQLMVFAVLGTVIGARLAHRLPVAKLKKAFAGVMILTATQLLWKLLHG